MRVRSVAVALLASGCGLCSFGSLDLSGSGTSGHPTAATAVDDIDDEPPPRRKLAAELGVTAGTETMFSECTDPEGLGVGLFAGVGWRPDGLTGYGLRGGAGLAHHAEHHGLPERSRQQIWLGPSFHHVDRKAVLGLGAFATVSRYGEDGAATWGAGFSLDGTMRRGFHMGLRLSGDREGVYGGLNLGYVLWR